MNRKHTILFDSSFGPQEVVVHEITSSRAINPDLEHVCKKEWKETVIHAKEQGRKLWDSSTYRLESAEVEENLLRLTVSTIPFSIRLTMNDHRTEIARLGIGYAAKGMFTSCLVVSSDDKYIFIEKSSTYYTQRKYAFVGGVLIKTRKKLSSGTDLFQTAKDELKEEIGVYDSHIQAMILKSGYVTENFNVCLLFEIKLSKTFAEVRDLFAEHNDGEAVNVLGINKSELPTFAAKMGDKDLIKFRILKLI